MLPTFPPLAALFLTHFHDLTGQEVVYYRSLSEETLPAGQIEHTSLPSGLHNLPSDLVLFTHCSLPAAGLFRSVPRETGRGRRMGTLGVVLAPPTSPDALFALEEPLGDLYDRLEGVEDPFASGDTANIAAPKDDEEAARRVGAAADAAAVKALLDSVWEGARAAGVVGMETQTAAGVAVRLGGGVGPNHPVTYLPALLSMLGPSLVTVYKAALSGQRVLLYATPPLLPLEAFAWCIWAMGLPPASASTGGARSPTWLGNVGLMALDDVKKRTGGWVATTTDVVYKSHTDAYDMFIDFSASLPADVDEDVRGPPKVLRPAPTILVCTPSSQGKPKTSAVTYAFGDLALYRSLVLLDQSPRGVRAQTVGFSATSRAGGMWLVVFEMIERLWSLCVGVCEFALGRGNVGAIALEDDEGRALLGAGVEPPLDDNDEEEWTEVRASTDADEPLPYDGRIPDDTARRGRLILDQLHHYAYHQYGRLMSVAAGGWELSDADLRTLTGASRIGWGGRDAPENKFWLALARTWNVEPTVDAGVGAGEGEHEHVHDGQ